jgi:soluble lytic murein transglycosylase
MKYFIRRLVVFCICLVLLINAYQLLQDKLLRVAYPIFYEDTIMSLADEYSMDPALILAVIRTESSWRKDSVSVAGARGLMQITSPTFDFIKMKAGWADYSYDDLFSPEINIRFGVFFLSFLVHDFEGNTDTALAAYNAGRGNVQKWLKDPRYSEDGSNLAQIPFRETRNYVKRVNAAFSLYNRLYFTN